VNQVRDQLTVNGDLVPLKALGISHGWHFGAREVTVRRVSHETRRIR
jgi:hypothetical protein